MRDSIDELVEAATNATHSLRAATSEMKRERKTRRTQVWIEATVLTLIVLFLYLFVTESRDRAALEADKTVRTNIQICESINDGRVSTRTVLEIIAAEVGTDNEKFQAVIKRVSNEVLQDLDCEALYELES